MKKILKWIGIAVLTPILLFIILAALLYLPPVQNWAVQKVTAIASDKTGMEISVGHVNLEWPFDLGIDDFRILHDNDSLPGVRDTIADIRKLVADIQLWPLLEKRVVIDELSLHQAKINTNGFISDLRVKGEFERLWLASDDINLSSETVVVNGASMKGGKLDIALSDTAAVDTTESDLRWKIKVDSLSIYDTAVNLHLPGDTLDVGIKMGSAVAREANIDLGRETYQIGKLEWTAGGLTYDDKWMPRAEGLDLNHLALSDISLAIDSISYTPKGTSLMVRHTAMKEKCGLEISELKGLVKLDSAFNNIQLPGMTLRTPDSDIHAEADIDFNIADAQKPGRMRLRLFAQIGKQDLMHFMGGLPQSFIRSYPNHPISIKGSVNGNMRKMDFTGLDISLPTALHLHANGTAEHLTDMSRMKADISFRGQTQDLNFLTALIDDRQKGEFRIPSGITLDGRLRADGTRYDADLEAREGEGFVKAKIGAVVPQDAKGNLNTEAMTYDADISIDNLNLHHFLPKDSLYTLSADIHANGYGTDILNSRCQMKADATVNRLKYGQWNLDGLKATANLKNGRGILSLNGDNHLFNGTMTVDALLSTKKLDGTISADIAKIDLQQLRLVDEPLVVGVCGHVDITSDMKQSHYVSGLLGELFIQDEKSVFRPADIGILLNTRPDTTYLRAQSGDFIVKLDASGGYEKLFRQFNTLTDSIIAQFDQKVIDQQAIKRLLPTMKMHVESRRDNPIANLLRTSDVDFKELFVDLTTSPETGINGQSHLYSLNYDSTRIDTIRLNLTQKGDRLTYQGQIRNNRRNPQFVFNALVDGHVHQHGALAGLRYFDANNRMGVRIGATAEMEEGGIRFKLMPDRPTLGYKEFNLNKDNYIFLGEKNKIQAKVDLIADDGAGMKIYSENQDSTMLQDLTVSLNRIDLDELSSVIPYMPHLTGKLNGDYHILMDQEEHISVASDMAVMGMTFEGASIGDLSTEMVYLQKDGDTHAIEARLMLNDEEFGLLKGSYYREGLIDATFDMTRMPLSLVNGFVPDQIVGLDGYAEGSMTIRGTTTHPDVNGEIYVDDAHLISIPYGIRMRFDNDPVRIVGSKLLLENFGLYAYNNEPLNMMGSIDFSNTDKIMADLRVRAQDLLLINAKQDTKSIAWGKAFVNFFAHMQGPLDAMHVRGRLEVLGSTDMTYLLLDSPLSTDNRLDELVKFTDFSDSTQTVITRPIPTGLTVDLNINVSQGAHFVCNLNPEQTNYLDLTGGGKLHLNYGSEGLKLDGDYTLSNGEMNYSLPIIPLKTFTIQDGSSVAFSGDPMNPKLNITATERTKASVSDESGVSRSVVFDCGVEISKTLNDMGLKFIISAPEDNTINGELNTMSEEERGKIAVTMLTTGMYLADGNTNGFSMNAALSSFLQSEINNITGSALKTLDVSIGIDNTTDASGTMHTDYSFKFAKRFLNNRLKIEIGGLVSSGDNTAMGQKQSFFDNVSMEYRLNQNATQNLKMFYKQNVYDWLEGYNSEYGVGFVWRRKLDNFLDIFRFWRKEQQPIPFRPRTPTEAPRDSIEVKNEKVNQ